MKKMLAAFAAAVSLATFTASAAEDLFSADEINLLGFGDYYSNQSDHWGGGIGLNYFLSRNIGIGASTHMENFSGTFIDNVAGELYLRVPLGASPIAPYAVGTGGYSFEYDGWFGGGGGGLEWRFGKAFGLFGDIQYLVHEGNRNDGIGVRFGFRVAL